MNTAKSVDVLRTLIEVNNSSIAGYESALKETSQADLKILFSQFEQKSRKSKAALISEVHKLNNAPLDGPEPEGTSHRAWLDHKGPLTGKDRRAMLNLCEYLEKAAANAYEAALEYNHGGFTDEQQAMLYGQHTLIKENLKEIKILEDRLND